jgi:hypothetical protein
VQVSERYKGKGLFSMLALIYLILCVLTGLPATMPPFRPEYSPPSILKNKLS